MQTKLLSLSSKMPVIDKEYKVKKGLLKKCFRNDCLMYVPGVVDAPGRKLSELNLSF